MLGRVGQCQTSTGVELLVVFCGFYHADGLEKHGLVMLYNVEDADGSVLDQPPSDLGRAVAVAQNNNQAFGGGVVECGVKVLHVQTSALHSALGNRNPGRNFLFFFFFSKN
jgi:hypothetical protein